MAGVLEPAEEVPTVTVPRPILPIERLGALIEVVLCSGFPTQLALIVVLRGSGMPFHAPGGRLSPPFVFTLSLLDATLVIGVVLFLLRARGESVRHVLFGSRPLGREALLGILILPAIFLFVVLAIAVLLTIAPQLHNVPQNPLEDMLRTRRDALIFGVVVMIAGGVREEIQRGFIVHRFRQYLGGAGWGVGAYSVLFGLGHYEQGYDVMIVTALLGAVWGVLYVARRSIMAPVVSHALFNLTQLAKYFAMR